MKFPAWTASLWLALSLPAAAAPPEPDGYRQEAFRAPVPATLKGAQVLTTEQAKTLWQDKRAVFVDVLPQAPRPKNLPAETVWRDPPRLDIPGSVWLADTGYGELNEIMLGYFRDGLAKASGGDLERTLVFYCLRDCWMSWNAAKRAETLGYKHVAWYPDGTDGWREAGLALEDRKPEPRP
jgi:PQQ-dependent catabolism-associated CXXCW motif protein